MKKIIGLIILVFWGTSALMSQQYHYYYQGDQLPLTINTDYAYLLLEGVQSPAELQDLIGNAEVTRFDSYLPAQTLDQVPGAVSHKGRFWAEIKFADKLRPNAYQKRLDALANQNAILRANPYFSNPETDKIGLSDLFLVKLEELGDPQALMAMAAQANVEVVGRNKFMPEWYTLQVTPNSAANALQLANEFYESGRFAAVEPDLMVDDLPECVNDPFFNNQWGHENTGQWPGAASPDIDACNGWANWGTGNIGTIVAVLDHGFEQNHPDLIGNNVGTGFDSESGTTPALVLGSHGTACAGVVAATRNNNIGISGVAPNCGLMSISNSLAGSPNSRQKRADGINWAWQNGAAVISNSWVSGVQYQVIDDAIVSAMTNGRGGLGTVIVFAAGNGNSSNVRYPANAHPDIIAVGAMSPCAERKQPGSCDGEGWGSDYGTDLDVAAPGVKIPTTDRQGTAGYNNSAGTAGDYTQTFNGTSSACPHVAGLAGLIISLNPCLTHLQVAEIIERSAQKVGTYAYANSLGRPHGTWHQEVGYGLIDIDAAMQMTRELYIQNVTLTGTETFQVHGKIFAGSNVDPNQAVGPVNINAGANIDFKASTSITMDAGFNVFLGATFTASIITTNCATWDVNAREAAPTSNVVVDPQTLNADANVAPAAPASLLADLSVIPNPFNNELTLRYTLEEGSQVQAKLFNFHGQEVANLINATDQTAGNHQKTVTLRENLPAGMYFVRMLVNGQGTTQKLLKQ